MQSKITSLERNRKKEMIFHHEIANKTPVCQRSFIVEDSVWKHRWNQTAEGFTIILRMQNLFCGPWGLDEKI